MHPGAKIPNPTFLQKIKHLHPGAKENIVLWGEIGTLMIVFDILI